VLQYVLAVGCTDHVAWFYPPLGVKFPVEWQTPSYIISNATQQLLVNTYTRVSALEMLNYGVPLNPRETVL
jgi:hypothetical protein